MLVHPDYEFAEPENKREYERLLERFRSDPDCDIMTLGEMTEWWNMRSQARIQIDDGNASIAYQGPMQGAGDLQAQLVTGYGDDGFSVVNVS